MARYVEQKENAYFLINDPEPEVVSKFTRYESFKGVKLYGVYELSTIPTETMEILDKGKMCLMLHGIPPVDELGSLAETYSSVRIFIAHLYNYKEYSRLRCDNLFFDTSGRIGSIMKPDLSLSKFVIQDAVRWVGSEKILFGSDYDSIYYRLYGSQKPFTYFCALSVLQSQLSEEEKENILFKNFKRVVG